MNFIKKLPWLRYIKNCKWIISILLFTCSTYFLYCCSNPKQVNSFSLTSYEKRILKEFFRDLLFENGGIYTLYGTKPASEILIQQPFTEKEKKEFNEFYEHLPKGEKAKWFKARYNFFENYQQWEKIRPKFPISQYLFGKFRLDERTEVLIFVNIEETIRTFIKNYDTFKRILGYDFDPVKMVFEVEDKNSKFWNELVSQRKHAFWGIIFDYGEDNAWFFEYNMKYRKADGKIGEFFRTFPSSFNLSDSETIRYPDPQHFNLPIFRRFGEHPRDKKLHKKYQKEQKMIRAIYKGKDEVEVSLEKLTRHFKQDSP